jgi:hypothetical protein
MDVQQPLQPVVPTADEQSIMLTNHIMGKVQMYFLKYKKMEIAKMIMKFVTEHLSILLLISAIISVYFYFFYNKRLRWFNTSIMIYLEPENQDYCKKISNMFYRYLYHQNNMFDFGNEIKIKINFFNEIKGKIKKYTTSPKKEKCKKTQNTETPVDMEIDFQTKIEYIQSNVFNKPYFKNEEFYHGKAFKQVDKDKYLEGMDKLINSNFSWSRAPKFNSNEAFKEFFETDLEELFCEQLKNEYNKQMNTKCIFNFVDLENIELNDIAELSNNKLIVKYGQYLEKPLYEKINEIQLLPNYKNVDEFLDKIKENEFYTTVQPQPPIQELVNDLVNEIKKVLFDFYKIDETFYKAILEHGVTGDVIEEETCGNDAIIDNTDFGSDIDKRMLRNNIEILNKVESFYSLYNSDEKEKLLREHYLLVERLVYTTFNTKDNSNVFNDLQQKTILNIYQNIIDFVYLENYREMINVAIDFTIRYILSEDPIKDEKLDNLLELYVAIDECFILIGKYKAKLEDYNMKRKPDTSRLIDLYKCNQQNIYDYFIDDGIGKQWGKYFKGERPPRYSWIFGPLVDDIDNTYNDLKKSLEPFTEHFADRRAKMKKRAKLYKEDVVEHFGDGAVVAGAIAAGVATIAVLIYLFFDMIVELPKIFIMLVKVLKNITDPFQVIEILGKFLMLLLLWLTKLLFFTVRLPKDKGMFLFGEYILYFVVLFLSTAFNGVIGAVLLLINLIFMSFDEYTNGFFYRLIYWLVGATENAPASWYLKPGYHYGYDSCNKSSDSTECNNTECNNTECDNTECNNTECDNTECNNTECDNSYENKSKRMFFAYYPCGNNHKPDRETKGLFCKRKYDQEPAYCLQANIFRLKNNLNVVSPIIPDRFIPSLDYFKATKAKRKDMHSKYKQMKKNFYNNCGESMYEYDGLTKNICKLYPSIVNEGDRNKMETMCYNAYCVNGKREPFCYRMTKSHTFMNQRNKSVIPRVFVITLYVIVLSYIINKMIILNTD